jgi:transcriptional regulator with XRE-family HTH domain
MSDKAPIYEDFDAYFATFDEEERQQLAHASAALDLSILLHRARAARGLTQTAAAARSGVKQQAISRWEHSHPNMKLDSLQKYLEALGYQLELVIKDAETGAILNLDVFAPPADDELGGDAPAPAPDYLLSRTMGQS